jgi:hypothetical protein
MGKWHYLPRQNQKSKAKREKNWNFQLFMEKAGR